MISQAANERSNNAKNAFTLISEMFSNGNMNLKEHGGCWDSFVAEVLPTILSKCVFHK